MRKASELNTDAVQKEEENTTMKLIRFTIADSSNPCFGVVVGAQAVSFTVLQSKAGKSSPHLADSRSYLANLPDSERAAKEMLVWAEHHLGGFGNGESFPSTPFACLSRWMSPRCTILD